MEPTRPVVVDTNILFSALLYRESPFAQHLLHADVAFAINALVVIELFKHKERIVTLSELSETEVVRLFYRFLRRINVIREDLVARAHR